MYNGMYTEPQSNIYLMPYIYTQILLRPYEKPTSSISISVLVQGLASP